MVIGSMLDVPQEARRRPALALAAAAGASSAALAAYALLRELRRQRPGARRVCDLLVYPLKSGAEVRVSSATATARGFEGDRVFQATDATGKFVTPRDSVAGPHQGLAEKLLQVRCVLVPGELLVLSSAARPDLAPQGVDLRCGKTEQVEAAVLGVPRPNSNREVLEDHGDEAAACLQRLTGMEGVRLTSIGARYRRVVVANCKQGDDPAAADCPVSLADEAPYLLTSSASLLDLKRRIFWKGELRASFKVDMRRFRPNVVVHGTLPWEEDSWRTIRIGRREPQERWVVFQVWQRCGRCIMTTFDRDTLQRDKTLDWLRSFRYRPGADGKEASAQANFGMHLIPIEGCPSDIAVGDTLEVLARDEAREKEWKEKFGPEWALGCRFSLGLPSGL